MASVRTRRIAREVIAALADIVDRRLRDPRVKGVTFTAVDVSPDLKHAKVYYSTLGSAEEREECDRGLNAASGYLRRELGKNLELRFTPERVFLLDGSLEKADRIQRLLAGDGSAGVDQ